MDKRAEQGEPTYRAVCTWCGVLIRRTDTKPSRGMCLKCFARMLQEHTRPFQSGDKTYRASDR
jgi:hypothetical protein